jgi:hypothetical protein
VRKGFLAFCSKISVFKIKPRSLLQPGLQDGAAYKYKSDAYNNKTKAYTYKSDSYNNKTKPYNNKSDSYNNKTKAYNNKSDTYNNKTKAYNNKSDAYNNKKKAHTNKGEGYYNKCKKFNNDLSTRRVVGSNHTLAKWKNDWPKFFVRLEYKMKCRIFLERCHNLQHVCWLIAPYTVKGADNKC